jgi:hypothetical protein
LECYDESRWSWFDLGCEPFSRLNRNFLQAILLFCMDQISAKGGSHDVVASSNSSGGAARGAL